MFGNKVSFDTLKIGQSLLVPDYGEKNQVVGVKIGVEQILIYGLLSKIDNGYQFDRISDLAIVFGNWQVVPFSKEALMLFLL